MSKPSAKKIARQNRKRHQKQLHHLHQKRAGQTSSFVSPPFSGENVGAPTAAARWFGQKVASLLRPGKP